MSKEIVDGKKKEMNSLLTNFRTVLNREVTSSVLEKCTLEQVERQLKTNRAADHLWGARIVVLIIKYALSPKEPKQFLQHGLGKGYSQLRLRLVLPAIRAIQQDKFKLFRGTEGGGPLSSPALSQDFDLPAKQTNILK